MENRKRGISIIDRSGSFPTCHPEEHVRFAQCKLRDEGSYEILQAFGLQDDPSGKIGRKTPRGVSIISEKTPKLAGVVKAPPSKSYTHRAIMVGGVNGGCKIINPLYSNDTLATINVWRELGAVIKKNSNYLQIKGVYGLPHPLTHSINVGESGTLLRFILPIIALANGKFRVGGEKTLLGRSNRTIVEALKSWNVEISGVGGEHKLPIRLKGKGEIAGGKIYVSGGKGS